MIKAEHEDVGRVVIYIGARYPGGKKERGIITSISEHFVFVRYGMDTFSKATLPADLEWGQP